MELSTGTFYRRMLSLAIPIALQNMLASCASLIDTAMVARLGNVATSAVGIGGRWTLLINVVIFGFCSGSSVFISQFWGAGQKEGVRRAYSVGMVLCLAAAAVYTALAASMPYQLISLFTKETALREAGSEYLRIVAWGGIPLAFAGVSSMARRSVEQVRLPLVVSTIAVGINTFLNYCLIYGNLGFPKMGLPGAAWATLTSQIAQALMMLIIGAVQKHFTVVGLAEIRHIQRAFVKRYLHVAAPVICNETLWVITFNMYSVIYAHQGSENYAAYTLYSSIENLVFVFFVGVCNACGIMIGKYSGQGLKKETYHTGQRILRLVVGMGLVLGGCLFLLRWPIIHMLKVETAYAAGMTANILAFYCLWCPMRQLSYVSIVGVLRAGGDTRTAMLLDVGVSMLWGLPITFLLAYVFKVPFMWIVCGTFLAEDTLKVPLALLRFRSKKWIHCLTDSSPQE